MSPPIYTPDGSEVNEIVLPDGSTASEVIGPDGNVVFKTAPDIPDSGGTHQWNTNEGSGTTLTDAIGSLDGTINGATWTSGAGTGGTHLDYNGSSDYTDLGSASQSELSHFINNQTGTLFAAVKPSDISDDEAIFGTVPSTRNNGFIFRFSGGDLEFLAFYGQINEFVSASSPDIQNDVWQAVAVVLDGSNYNFYHRNIETNDNLDLIGQVSINEPAVSGDLDHNVSIGRVTSDDSRHFDGGVDYSFTDAVARSQSSLASIADDLESFYP